MNLSENGFNLIKKFEGCKLSAYKPLASERYFTIGYGHYGKDVTEGETITQAKAEQMLAEDVKFFVAGVSGALKVPVNQNQFDALVSFSYNLGLANLHASDLLTYVNEGQFLDAANEFPKWCHANGVVLQGLVNRREAEKALFLTPVKEEHPVLHPNPYIIKEGDNLTKIAKKYKTTVKQLLTLNPQIVDKNVIETGQTVQVPYQVESESALKSYSIVRGETLSGIATRFNTSVKHLLLINPTITDPDKIYIGQVIKVPNR